MKITNVRVRVVEKDNSKMRGFASVTIDNQFVVHDIKILEGDNGLFLEMPKKQITPGEYSDVVQLINDEACQIFTDTILAEYEVETRDTAKRKNEEIFEILKEIRDLLKK